ncbi:acylphosphatase [Sphingobacterium chuzhouense]|uniref:acylphosphatase n=1 Tax=Sphingobacterium chuzhouense TaxID=1742264 RepID=A0ABR7XW16_9SPHI|nr:acylphosphatase [Sphingobacterium chuzhouense]MBD1423243.1 acylphosphatase [Sphingobacterium chuzhouense]
MKHLNITVTGKVQGVYYRATCKAVADQLGIKGFVMNQPDGTVYIEAEGDTFALEALLEFCHEGPDRAEVAEVRSVEGTFQGFKNFDVNKKKR